MSGYPHDSDIPFGGPVTDAVTRRPRCTPRRVPDSLAPAGHRIDIAKVANGLSPQTATRNSYYDVWAGICECGRRFQGTAERTVADWCDHLDHDRDTAAVLRRALYDAEHEARQARARTILNAQLEESTP